MSDGPVVTDAIAPDDHEVLARRIIRQQAALSVRIAAVFLALLFGLPLVNAFWPDVANRSIGGFPANWLALAILFFPLTWLLSLYFIRASERIESSFSGPPRGPAQPAPPAAERRPETAP